MSAIIMPAHTLDFMKIKNCIPVLALITFASFSLGKKQWVDLFNGKDLSGWENPYEWGEASVVDGMIELVGNKKFFLSTKKQYSDFEFTAEVKLPDGQANSGFLFRAQRKPSGQMFGYQAEVDGAERRWSGGLYDEGRRKWIQPIKPVDDPQNSKTWTEEKRNALKRNDWNRYRIKCVGEKLQVWVNGINTLDIIDNIDSKGYFGLQHHGEKGQVYRFRNIKIKELN